MSEPPPEPTPTRFAEPVFVWAVFGFLVGIAGPGLSMVVLGLGLSMGVFVGGSLLAGVGGGVLMGLIDPPGWVRRTSDPGARVPLALLAVLALTVLGALWSGLAGLGGAVALAGSFWLIAGAGSVLDASELAALGGVLGVAVGTPVVVTFGLVRLVAHLAGRPFVPSVIAALLVPTGAAVLGLLAMMRWFDGPLWF